MELNLDIYFPTYDAVRLCFVKLKNMKGKLYNTEIQSVDKIIIKNNKKNILARIPQKMSVMTPRVYDARVERVTIVVIYPLLREYLRGTTTNRHYRK